MKNRAFNNVVILPEEVLRNDSPSSTAQNDFLEILESPEKLLTSKASVFNVKLTKHALEALPGSYTVYVTIHCLTGTVPLYKKKLQVPCLRQYLTAKEANPEEGFVCHFLLRLAENPGTNEAIICCQLFHTNQFVAQISARTTFTKKRKSKGAVHHADTCLALTEYLPT